MPGRPRRAGRRCNAEVQSRMQGRSRRTGWFRNAEVESRMQSISRGAFLSHQRHVRHRKLRVMRRKRHGLGAYRDQRCRQRNTSERKIGHAKHPLLPPNGDNTMVVDSETVLNDDFEEGFRKNDVAFLPRRYRTASVSWLRLSLLLCNTIRRAAAVCRSPPPCTYSRNSGLRISALIW